MKPVLLVIVTLIFSINFTSAQKADALHPIVKGFGGVYEIEDAVEIPENKKTKILVDLIKAETNRGNPAAEPDFSKPIWGLINTARLLNLHGVGGVSKENLEVIVVVHGTAVMSLFEDKSYQEFFETKYDNPNLPILDALHEAGVRVVVCGQSLLARDIKKDQLFEHTEIALSALTTISKRVQEGYVVYNF
ncbi:MAG: DsrE family protein [Salegentibacter sp.]|uniref:DsrE/DsrF-like family protein n=1 Tax=Salegentibacter flavus TaxID=287099 RepID=A0A1I5C569_9FLAO|nr:MULTISPECIES: DsrE family protein [Salegentibacter]MDR9457345.1 DsrE family protein [Salegentibacter sp.]SFN82220.1 DsrE/DsrF-like family protein [Salegentibacter flavus]